MRRVIDGHLRLSGENLDQAAFPLGGLGAGNFCVSGAGMPVGFSIFNSPDYYNDPNIFAAVYIRDGRTETARVLEGQVPYLKLFGGESNNQAGHGDGTAWSRTLGLPRYQDAFFVSSFPFADIALRDEDIPLECDIKAWSPFIPGDPDDSGLPCGILEYRLKNPTDRTLSGVFYFASESLVRRTDECYVRMSDGGYTFVCDGSEKEPWKRGSFTIRLDGEAMSDATWFRGGWFDPITMVWNGIMKGERHEGEYRRGDRPSAGGTLSAEYELKPGGSASFTVILSWHFPDTDLRCGEISDEARKKGFDESMKYRPFYASRFGSSEEVSDYVKAHLSVLRERSKAFSDAFYGSDLRSELKEAAAANLSILKSPTVLRQYDGRLWCWEGSMNRWGSCHGSCEHVWNYAQAIPHLFPSLERTLRETEFLVSQDERGHQTFRSNLPICETTHTFHAASDGQLGGIMKLWREYVISGDIEWLKKLLPAAKKSIEYCIRTWDPDENGLLSEPHHNTYDIEFWGPDGMCTSFYLGALKAMSLILSAAGEDGGRYLALYEKGRAAMEEKLWNGEYFIQKIEWKNLHAKASADTPEERERLDSEGPKYQYGTACLSDGVLGAWMAHVCFVGEILDPAKVEGHLMSVYRYNLKKSLKNHSNTQRPGYASASDGGLLLASWPHGGKLSLPFVYSDEVWTGIEYQVASHLISIGHEEEGLDIVTTLRDRYDGRRRNPFDEYECGHFYARALASWALLEACSGVSYDKVSGVLRAREDGNWFLAGEDGFGLVRAEAGKEAVWEKG